MAKTAQRKCPGFAKLGTFRNPSPFFVQANLKGLKWPRVPQLRPMVSGEKEKEKERKDGGAEEREARYWGQNGDKKRGQGRISYYKNTNSELPIQAGLPLFEANQPNRRTKGSFERPLSLKETQDLPPSQATDCGPTFSLKSRNFVGSKFSILVPMRTQASGFQVCHYNKWINLYLTRRRSHSRRLEPLLLWKERGPISSFRIVYACKIDLISWVQPWTMVQHVAYSVLHTQIMSLLSSLKRGLTYTLQSQRVQSSSAFKIDFFLV